MGNNRVEFRTITTIMIVLLSSLKVVPSEGQGLVPPVSGLAYGFYNSSCPSAENTVKTSIQSFLSSNVSQAAGVIRLFFHDCFVQGCDASLLVNDTNGEQTSIPNRTLRASALAIIDQIKSQLESNCPGIVSCADILSLAARECVNQSGGPFFQIPTGRRDGLNFSNNATVLQNIPAPTFSITQLNSSFSAKGLNETDLVALSGAHTIGLAHCRSFSNRLRPTVDPTLNSTLATNLLQQCPNSSINVVTNMDIVTPDTFDNQYYTNNLNGNVLFTSDAALLNDTQSQSTVQQFANNNTQFLQQFSISFIKMSMIGVLTGSDGNIRNVCSVLNATSSNAETVTVAEIIDEFMEIATL
ncbi:hypothetical protein O6H91_07G086400 [Diphasiastrum complanatum]|uniref:Uncharacterized protein n=2 Tax=Diphasiastrum complanatum TaxID=34168 RepID=A0ACC2D421_DIPCM|nr:hypothetical protein O6H91_07G023200 [Diphasiastrum complanatum]KAJ7550172.1 hypothetical protein O6H91_07G086400 [Diphasiastrum complanatum]